MIVCVCVFLQTFTMKVRVPFSFWGITMLCTAKTNRASLDTPEEKSYQTQHNFPKQLQRRYAQTLEWRHREMGTWSLTRWKLEGDGEAVMWTRPLWPLQLGVERVQDVELHGFKEAVTLVFKYNRHHHLTAILQVALDVIFL